MIFLLIRVKILFNFSPCLYLHLRKFICYLLILGRLPSSPSVFTSDEYRAWLSRAPSTSALYETLRPRLPTHYSAENIHDALKNVSKSLLLLLILIYIQCFNVI
jgi:hypothetical protein